MILARRQLDRPPSHIEWREIPHDTNSLRYGSGLSRVQGCDVWQVDGGIIAQRCDGFQARVEAGAA
jgi:hypothetical protein